MTKSLFEKNLDDVQEVREAPAGKYFGKIVYCNRKELDDEKERISIGFKANSAEDDVDLDGVNLNRYLYKTIILSEAAFPYVKKELLEAGLDTSGVSIKELLASLEGREAEFTVGQSSYSKQQGKPYRAEVLTFKVL